MQINWVHVFVLVGALYIARVVFKSANKTLRFGYVTHVSLHSDSDSGKKICFSSACPHGDMEVRVVPIQEGPHFSGLVIVKVHKYGVKTYWLPKPRKATLFLDSARKHWWQFGRYRYVGDVVEKMKRWAEQKVAEIKMEEELLAREEYRLMERDAKVKEMMEKFPLASSGALSKAGGAGGEVAPAQSGEMDNVIEMRPSSVEPQKK